MSKIVDILIPDIGDFAEVDVIEVLVSAGEEVIQDDSLLTLESDKATMEIPAPYTGRIVEMGITVGDKVKEGSIVGKIEIADVETVSSNVEKSVTPEPTPEKSTETPAPQAVSAADLPDADMQCDVLVLGSGPGGYTAAFRAADLGKKVVMIERYENIGGVCLNVGCIPSKALLHMSVVLNETREMGAHGITFAEPEIDTNKIRAFKDSVVGKLTGGLAGLAKARKVEIVQGYGKFSSANTVTVEAADGSTKTIAFENAIIAAGSRVVKLPFIPHDDPRVMDSTDALELEEVPKRMLVIGGGIIGLEMAQVYNSLGASITVVELGDTIIPGADKDISKPLLNKIKKQYENIYLKSKVTNVEAKKEGLVVTFEGKDCPETDTFDRILVAVGRAPNGKLIDAEKAGVAVNDWGFIEVDERQKTNVDHIYAIGDIVGQPMLAHKAAHEGKVAAEVIAGMPSAFTPMGIPSVAYTDPEVAWAGKTEAELKAEGIAYEKGSFPWAASGRSLSLGRDEGLTKALFCAETHRLLGCGIVGPNAGELIAEAMLAIEMGADMQDIGLTIHPHPTLSETLCFAAEMAEGTITDLMPPKKKK
ncbi:MAG: dihydrolipoyl dehydrogenase [Piscirickettsiaceae bacterium CG_4_10_14_3_um_filter_44_349]|nr:dihydrolipoyl dehydrogenase [Thiomicrospira sp.]OIP95521.1 MAG: dihydrolipoyl dehydrogenase [Thiomicrospira sp. CG2_30_44_34]PIQ06279.1 MAG: dihydrolipoyl dehydrogenase [Piscirickettsiaceae bacterium CG18_big_fil_WC_8_21_14_2_50_44_103]PIX80019.1 MAG: dihydrolipoyl dehydrogenase [Piscirickettsiaceae bacterium CG_4_10_14_3_um_filter_44_349]PJC34710.1 MAG: dihydrolipoyl dehydrogenase [Piscirickettsiaceae bacterium CG_4_9_14_0_2_um_filter_44_546]